eukprot:190697_1
MKKIKNASNTQKLNCPFNMRGLIWDVEISHLVVGNVSLYLRLLSLPPKISEITVDATFYIQEIDFCRKMIAEFVERSSWGYREMFPTQRIQRLSQLTIKKAVIYNI